MISPFKGNSTKEVKEMIRDTKEPKKVCPHCHKQYSEEDRYCGDDGAQLAVIDSGNRSPKGDHERDIVPDSQIVSGREGIY